MMKRNSNQMIFKSNHSIVSTLGHNHNLCIKTPCSMAGIHKLHNEINAIRRLENSHNRTLYKTFDNSHDFPYIVMHKADYSLRDLLFSGTLFHVTSKSIYSLLSELVSLVASEKTDFIHGDLKPENILFHQNHFYLIDFGESPVLDESHSYTLKYASPELIASGKPSIHSDIYAMLYILLECIDHYQPGFTYPGITFILNSLLKNKSYLDLSCPDLLQLLSDLPQDVYDSKPSNFNIDDIYLDDYKTKNTSVNLHIPLLLTGGSLDVSVSRYYSSDGYSPSYHYMTGSSAPSYYYMTGISSH